MPEMTIGDVKRLALEIWGMDDLEEVFNSAALEREALLGLYDQNEALKICNRRLRLLADLAKRTFEAVIEVGGLFLPQKVRDTYEKFQTQYRALDVTRADSRELVEEKAKRTA